MNGQERKFCDFEGERKRSLTDDDIVALKEALSGAHVCHYSAEEIVDIKRYRRGVNAIATAIGWGVIMLVGAAIIWLIAKGATLKGM